MADRVIKYRGEFDASQILASLKKVRSEMEKGGVDSSVFKGVDKDIEKTEKLITQMMAKIQTGFKDQKEVIAFEKQIAQVATDLSKIGIGLKNANLPENFKAAAAQITKMGNNLQNTVDSLAEARQEALAFVDAQQKSGRYTKAQAQAIKEAVDNEEELLQAVKRVNEEQSKKAGASLARSLTRTKDGVISDTTRKSMAQSITTGYSNENTLALAGAAAGIQDLEKYKQVMSSVVLEGKTLKEAMDSLQVEFNENDKEILESDNFLKIYAQDLKTLAFAAAETAKNEGYSVAKGNISKQANIIGEMGASNVSGDFVANTSGYDASIEKIHTLEAEILNLKSEIASLKSDVDASVNATNAKLDEENINLQQNSEAWKNSGQATREAAASADNFNDTFNNLQNIAKQVLSLTSAWRMFRQQVVNTYNDVKELDKSFAKIAMVTNYQVSDLWGQYENYADMANRLGQSTQSVVEASGLFYQQGLDTAEALALTEDTMKLATLAGLDFSEATSQMTAALRAFHMEMDEGSHITDVYAELAAHAAADVQGIAYAMSKTASIANSAGMSFENTSAFLTQMIETTQEAPENIGTAMKTIIARFTELKENVAGTADSEFDDLDYNKVDKALKTVGISIKDATGQFRNLDEVFLELSQKWDTLDRNSQRYIATIAAGSRQQSRFIAMMENYDRTIELVNTAYNSAGKSSEQFAKFSDSVEFKVNKLKNTWEQFRINLLSSEGYKSLLDTVTQIVSKFEGIDLKKLLVLTPMFLVLGRTLAKSWIQGLSDGLSKGSGLIDKAIGKLSGNGKSSIEIKADITKAKAKIEELKQEKAQLAADKTNIEIVSQETQRNLDNANKELEELNQQAKELSNQPLENLEQNFDDINKKINSTKTKVEELNAELNNLKSRKTETSSKQTQNETDLKVAVEGKKEISKGYNWKAIGSGVGTALGQSMATAAMMAFAGDFDLSDIAKTTAVQSGISAFTSLISGNWQMALGQAAIAGISLGINYISGKIAEANEKWKVQHDRVYAVEKEIEALENIQEKYNENLDEVNKEYDEQKEHWDTISEAANTYKDLKSRIALTTEQEEQLQEAQNTLIEECPELITRYGQAGQAIIDLGKNFDTVIEKQRQLYNEAALEQKNAEISSQLVSSTIAKLKVEHASQQLEDTDKVLGTYVTYDGAALEGTAQEQYSQLLTELTYYQYNTEAKDLKKYLKKSKGNYAKALQQFSENHEEYLKTAEEVFKLKNFDEETFGDWGDAEDYLRALMNSSVGTSFSKVFKEVLEEVSKDYDYLTIGNEKGEDLINLIDDLGEEEDEEIWNEVKEKLLERYSTEEYRNDLKNAEAEAKIYAKDQTEALQKSIADYVKIQAQASGLVDENDPMASYLYQALEKTFSGSTEAKQAINEIIASFEEDMTKAVESNDPEKREKAAEKATKRAQDALNSQLKTIYDSEKAQNIIKVYTEADSELKESIVQFYEDLGNVALEESQKFINDLKNSDVSPEITNLMQSYVDDLKEQSDEYKQELADILGMSYGYSGMGSKTFESTTLSSTIDEMAPQYQAAFAKAILDMAGQATSDEEKRFVINRFNDFLGSIGEGIDPLAFTYDFDWENLNLLNLEEQQEAFFDYYQNTLGHTLEEAKQAWELYFNFINTNTNRIDLTIDEAAVQEMANNVSEKFSNILSKFSGVKDIIQKQLTDGFINFSESQQLKEACEEIGLKAEDYLQYNADGTINFNAEQFKNDTKDQITNEEEIVNQLRAQVDQQIQQLDIQIAILEGDSHRITILKKQAKAQNDFNKQLANQANLLKSMGYISGDIKTETLKATKNYEVTDDGNEALEKLKLQRTELEEYRKKLYVGSDFIKPLVDQTNAAAAELDMTWDEIVEATKQSTEELEKAVEDAASKVKDAREKVVSALEDIQEAEEKVIEQTQKLNETLYGTDNHKNKSDSLYNYTTMLERLQKAADDAKNALDDISEGDNVQANVDTYLQKARDEATARQAENEVIRQSIQNYQNVLNDRLGQEIANMNSQYGANMDINISDFYYKKGDRWAINFQALNAANIPDEISDYVEETVAEMNKLEDSIEDNAEAIKKREKEIRELRKKGVQAEITLENEVANVLKEKYQEEVDNLKDKYKSMEEADNEYVDALKEAIDKQRELRSRQNEWENLATKEKKLSLLSRDTSGANKLTTQKLQKEIQSDREKLLNNSVDAIINNLKELYETQKETRDSEIEYQEALLENTNFIKEANTIIQSWESADDAISFFYKNVKNISEMSEAQLEQETESWKDMYEAHTLYLATNTKNFNDTLQHFEEGAEATNEEIQKIIKETSETLTNEATRSLNEISSKTSEAIKSAQDAVTDALDALAEKQKAYNEALENERQAVVSLAQAQRELNEARDAYKEALGDIGNQPTSSSDVVQQSTGSNITELGTMFRGLLESAVTNATNYKTGEINASKINWSKILGDFNKNYNAAADIETATDVLKAMGYHGVYDKDSQSIVYLARQTSDIANFMKGKDETVRSKYSAFKTGGLVDYTGPAWVDGSPTKPEAFLNPEDTERIGKAAELLSHLSNLLNFNTSPTENITNNSVVGDTTINVTVNVENISDDYDVDLAIERVKQEIVDAAAFTGANVILTQ